MKQLMNWYKLIDKQNDKQLLMQSEIEAIDWSKKISVKLIENRLILSIYRIVLHTYGMQDAESQNGRDKVNKHCWTYLNHANKLKSIETVINFKYSSSKMINSLRKGIKLYKIWCNLSKLLEFQTIICHLSSGKCNQCLQLY